MAQPFFCEDKRSLSLYRRKCVVKDGICDFIFSGLALDRFIQN